MIKPIYEFLLWDNCSNNCDFCIQRQNPRIFDIQQREKILNETLVFLNSEKFQKNSHVLICGGEIFDNIKNLNILINFFKKIIDLMNNNIIDLLYINTNLIYENMSILFNFLDLIKNNNLFNRLKFTTSFDLQGRFKNQKSKELMLNNLKKLKDIYIDINIVTNIILTKKVCEQIINNNFSIKNFSEKYKCYINLLPYIIYNPDLVASRTQIFKALKKVSDEIPDYLPYYIQNISIKQQKKLYVYRNNQFQYASCKISQCEHSINFKRYSTNNTCFCCDLKELFNG